MNRPNASAGRPALRRAAWAAAAAGLALCLALPALLCGAETAALERGTLARPALESTLTAEGQADPLAQALYQGRMLFDTSTQNMELDQDTIYTRLAQGTARLQEGGVLEVAAAGLIYELLDAEGEWNATRSADGRVGYEHFVYSGHLVQMTWLPDLSLPVEFMAAHPSLPAVDPDLLLQCWQAFLGEDSGSWQTLQPDGQVRMAWSADRQLLLSVFSGPGTLAVHAYSLSPQDCQAMVEQLQADAAAGSLPGEAAP